MPSESSVLWEEHLAGLGAAEAPLSARFAEIAGIGLARLLPEEAHAAMLELLPHPNQSHPRAPRGESNLRWAQAARSAWEEAQREFALPIGYQGARAAVGSPYPPMALAYRLEILESLGADLSVALSRCSFRRDRDAVAWLLSRPGPQANPNPLSGSGTTLLQRMAYQGPDEIFSLILQANLQRGPLEIPSLDRDFPEAWALRSHSKGRLRMLLNARLGEEALEALGPDWDSPSILAPLRAALQAREISSVSPPAKPSAPKRSL